MESYEPSELPEDPAELRRRVEQLEAELIRFREDEQFLVQTLVSATRQASEIRDAATSEGELIVRTATAEAEERASVLALELHDAEQELARLQQLTDDLRQGLSQLLNTVLGDLQFELAEVPAADEELGADADAATPADGSASLGGALEAALEERVQNAFGPEPVVSPDAEASPFGEELTEHD
jgi:cell division septum initiation protein DivIVA